MSTFRITKELLSSYCQAGMTVKEMANAITEASGFSCSVGKVKQACEAYSIDLRRKPLKSPFTFGDTVQTATAVKTANQEENAEGVSDQGGVRF